MDGQIDIAAPQAVPDIERLLGAIHERSPVHRSYIHGDQHWRAVAEVGLRLLPENRKADPMVVFLFSLFHDALRENEDKDPGHGRRGAELAHELHGRYFLLPPERLGLLIEACAGHTDVRFSDDPTIGVCFDADRLNLWRVGVRPDARWLSTAAARSPHRIAEASRLEGQYESWQDLFRRYANAAGAAAKSTRT